MRTPQPAPRWPQAAVTASIALECQESQQVDYRLYRSDRLSAPARPIPLGPARPGRYHRSMTPLTPPPRLKPLWRVVVEVAFIVFLFYANLLMGEFTRANGQGKTFAVAIHDIVTPTNFLIALISALIGYVVFEYLRHKL
jgi:hypothetical protein